MHRAIRPFASQNKWDIFGIDGKIFNRMYLAFIPSENSNMVAYAYQYSHVMCSKISKVKGTCKSTLVYGKIMLGNLNQLSC